MSELIALVRIWWQPDTDPLPADPGLGVLQVSFTSGILSWYYPAVLGRMCVPSLRTTSGSWVTTSIYYCKYRKAHNWSYL